MLIILAVAILIRISYLPYLTETHDMDSYAEWGKAALKYGIFGVYRGSTVNYPPLLVIMLALSTLVQIFRGVGFNITDPGYLTLLKFWPVAADLALIALVAQQLKPVGSRWKWLIPLFLAISPGLIGESAWWGQTDGLLTLVAVLMILCLSSDKVYWAWAIFAVALLLKFQSLPFAPLMVILTLRRFGLRTLISAALMCGCIVGIVLLPFIVASGPSNALRPYIGIVDNGPYLTINAFNFWYVATPNRGKIYPFPSDPSLLDTQAAFGPLSYKALGFVMLGLYTLLICVAMWRWHKERRDFLWATALMFGFFMWPTQIHERYLYPAALFAVFAAIQDPEVWLVALGTSYTVANNILSIVPAANSFQWLGMTRPVIWPTDTALPTALLNIFIMIEVTRLAIRDPRRVAPRVRWLTVGSIGMVAVVVVFAGAFVIRISDYATAQWMVTHLSDNSHVAFEWTAEDTRQFTHVWSNSATWWWQATDGLAIHSAADWHQQGVQYLLLDERDGDYDTRLRQFIAQGGSIIYQTYLPFARQAVLQTTPSAPA